MKRIVSILLFLALALGLTGCGEGDGSSPGEVASVSTGLSSVSSMTVADAAARIKTAVAAVLVGEDGRIRACQLDEFETTATLREGEVALDPDTRSNSEKLYEYGLVSASPIGREWFEQAAAFGDYVVGMTADEVASLPLSDGKVQDTVLSGRCELDVTDFVEAITQAARSAAPRGASVGDVLSMTVSRTQESGAEDRLRVSFPLSAVTLTRDGAVSSCLVDVAEAELSVKDGAFTAKNGRFSANKAKRNDLMVETASSESVGWFEQAAAFEKYVTGKTLTQIRATPLLNGRAAPDTELAETCFIPVAALLDSVVKTIEAASATGETAATTTTTARAESSDSFADAVESVAESWVDRAESLLSDITD